MSEKFAPDRIDFDILAALQNDARLSNKELAATVGLAPSSCLERVKRLRDRGVLRGAHAEVDPGALGIGLHAMVAVRIKRHNREQLETFEAHAMKLEEVVSIYHVAGPNDYLLHVAARNADHLRNFLLDSFTTRPEVDHMETALVFSHRHAKALPNYAGSTVAKRKESR